MKDFKEFKEDLEQEQVDEALGKKPPQMKHTKGRYQAKKGKYKGKYIQIDTKSVDYGTNTIKFKVSIFGSAGGHGSSSAFDTMTLKELASAIG